MLLHSVTQLGEKQTTLGEVACNLPDVSGQWAGAAVGKWINAPISQLTADLLGPIDAIYDRAALVALPEDMRYRYSAHLQTITQNAPQLLLTFVYDQSVMPGPPFSISQGEVQCHYTEQYKVQHLEQKPVKGGLKGVCPADEDIWYLQPL